MSEAFAASVDAAVEAHLEWTHRLLRVAALGGPPSADLTAPDAERRCALGSWLHRDAELWGEIDTRLYDTVGDRHRRMHEAARRLCADLAGRRRPSEDAFTEFERAQREMMAGLSAMKARAIEAATLRDPLTGLATRARIAGDCERLTSLAIRVGRRVVALLADADRFKSVNDTHGHPTGDLALVHLARVLTSHGRVNEPFYRYGGEEFLTLLVAESMDDAAATADRLLASVRDTPIHLPDDRVIRLTISAGLAELDERGLDDAIARADRALYRAKREGRDRWCLAG